MGFLYPYQVLDFDDLGTKTVADVSCRGPRATIDCTLADPLEGIGYGRCKGMVMRGEDGTLFIHSFCNTDVPSIGSAMTFVARPSCSRNSPTVDRAVEILGSTNFEADEAGSNSATKWRPVRGSKSVQSGGVSRMQNSVAKRERRRDAAEAAAASDGRISRAVSSCGWSPTS